MFLVFFWGEGVFLWFLLVILLLKMAPKKTVEMLSDVLKCKEIVMYLMKKNVFDKHYLDLNYNVDHKSNVHKSPKYIKLSLDGNTHKSALCIDWLMKML